MVQYFEEEIARLAQEYQPEGMAFGIQAKYGALWPWRIIRPMTRMNFTTRKYPIAKRRSLTDVFEPGSTFKIVPAAAALNEGLVSVEDSFDTGFAQISLIVAVPETACRSPNL